MTSSTIVLFHATPIWHVMYLIQCYCLSYWRDTRGVFIVKLSKILIAGNPVCQLDLHYEYTIAHLTTVVYLDYQLVDTNKRTEAMKQFDSIEQLTAEEEELSRKLEEEEKNEAERELHKEAYVEDLNGPQLFCSLFAEDTEAPKLAMLPDMDNMLGIFQESFTKVNY